MTAKQRRHAVLRQVLQLTPVRSQAELQAALAQHDVHVSQATLSRDIQTLGLVKMPLPEQRYCYVMPEEHMQQRRYDRLQVAFQHFVIRYEAAGQLLVIKTSPGSAHTVAVDLDALAWEEIIGTVAGDDTILVVTRSVRAVKQLHERLQRLLGLIPPDTAS
jgi:transcriptional regulator of arginine metabolism